MIQCDNAIESSCSPPPADQPWQVSNQMKAHNQEKVEIIFLLAILSLDDALDAKIAAK